MHSEQMDYTYKGNDDKPQYVLQCVVKQEGAATLHERGACTSHQHTSMCITHRLDSVLSLLLLLLLWLLSWLLSLLLSLLSVSLSSLELALPFGGYCTLDVCRVVGMQ